MRRFVASADPGETTRISFSSQSQREPAGSRRDNLRGGLASGVESEDSLINQLTFELGGDSRSFSSFFFEVFERLVNAERITLRRVKRAPRKKEMMICQRRGPRPGSI